MTFCYILFIPFVVSSRESIILIPLPVCREDCARAVKPHLVIIKTHTSKELESCVFLSLEWLFLLVSWVRWVKGVGVQNGGLVCCHYHKWALQNGIHHLDFLGFSDGFHFARCFANWRPGKVNGAHEIAWSGPLILYGIVFVIQIYGGCHSVHDISFSLIRNPILYQCLFRFLVVALILQQIYVQDGYPLRPMLISMGISNLDLTTASIFFKRNKIKKNNHDSKHDMEKISPTSQLYSDSSPRIFFFDPFVDMSLRETRKFLFRDWSTFPLHKDVTMLKQC